MTTPKVKVKGLDNKDYRVVQAKMRWTPDNFFFKKHFIGAIIGQRGSGKTNSMLSLVFHADKYKYFDKIYVISPTQYNDPKYELLETTPHHYTLRKFPTYTDEIFKEIVDEIKSDIDEYKEWERVHKIYLKFMKHGYGKMTPEEMLDVAKMMVSEDEIQEPECKWRQMPSSLILLDDLVGNTDLYKVNPKGIFWNFCILHRHLLTSLAFICQTYTAIPKQIRANVSLLLLFDLKPEIKKQVAEEMCANMSEKQFVSLWEEACVNAYDFFLCNFDFPKATRFRRNFDEIFLL